MTELAQRIAAALLVGVVLWVVLAQFEWPPTTATISAPAVAPGSTTIPSKTNAQLREEAAHKAQLDALARQEELLRKQEALREASREAQRQAAENRAKELARREEMKLERRKAQREAEQREDEARRERHAQEERRQNEYRERCAQSRAAWPGNSQDIPGFNYPCDDWGRYCGSQQTVDPQGRRVCLR